MGSKDIFKYMIQNQIIKNKIEKEGKFSPMEQYERQHPPVVKLVYDQEHVLKLDLQKRNSLRYKNQEFREK